MGKGKNGKSKGKGKYKKGDSKGKSKDKAISNALAARQEQSARDKEWNEWAWSQWDQPPSQHAAAKVAANAAVKPPHKTYSAKPGEYCIDHLQGNCDNPNTCGKAHNGTCNKWITGVCTAGNQCPFIHKKDVVVRTPSAWKAAANKAWKASQKTAGLAVMALTQPTGGDAAPASK